MGRFWALRSQIRQVNWQYWHVGVDIAAGASVHAARAQKYTVTGHCI